MSVVVTVVRGERETPDSVLALQFRGALKATRPDEGWWLTAGGLGGKAFCRLRVAPVKSEACGPHQSGGRECPVPHASVPARRVRTAVAPLP